MVNPINGNLWRNNRSWREGKWSMPVKFKRSCRAGIARGVRSGAGGKTPIEFLVKTGPNFRFSGLIPFSFFCVIEQNDRAFSRDSMNSKMFIRASIKTFTIGIVNSIIVHNRVKVDVA